MGDEDPTGALDVASIERGFERVRRGYDPGAVDAHLSQVRGRVERHISRLPESSDESLDLVLKATRRSVDEALQDARDRADGIVAEATATAETLLADARARAAEAEAEAEAKCRAIGADSRERYLEMGRLADVRAKTLADLDHRIAERRETLRAMAEELTSIAGAVDDAPAPVLEIAAMTDRGTEIVLPAHPAEEH